MTRDEFVREVDARLAAAWKKHSPLEEPAPDTYKIAIELAVEKLDALEKRVEAIAIRLNARGLL